MSDGGDESLEFLRQSKALNAGDFDKLGRMMRALAQSDPASAEAGYPKAFAEIGLLVDEETLHILRGTH